MKLKEEQIQLFERYLKENNKTIATMESCTGGYLANVITNVEGASDIFKYGAVTYSNEAKIKMGVSKDIIDTYTVYSKETAEAMATTIAEVAHSNLGIGITGQMGSIVYVGIYDKDKNSIHHYTISADATNRQTNKIILVNFIFDCLFEQYILR